MARSEVRMNLPVQITFRNVPSSKIVEEWIRREADKLETFYGRSIGCRVAVEVPHRHHRKGSPYHIRVDLALPGGEIVVGRAPNLGKRLRQAGESIARKRLELGHEYTNLHLAINETFRTATRALREYARRQRGEVKAHGPHSQRLKKGPGKKNHGFRTLESETGGEP
jgi:Sigma 54 modulation protein / S30EA ribosomal protein